MNLTILNKMTNSKFIPEHKFCDTRKWRFDFALLEKKIAIEVNGGVFTQGRHTRGEGFINDMEKLNKAVELGWRVLQYTPQQCIQTETFRQINAIIHEF